MSNTMPQRPDTHMIVAANLSAEIGRKRLSDRQIAVALGLTNNYVSRRTSGTVELSASDLVMFASHLRVPVTKFFEGVELPAMDSNHEPAGNESAAETRAFVTDIRSKARPPKTPRPGGPVRPVVKIGA